VDTELEDEGKEALQEGEGEKRRKKKDSSKKREKKATTEKKGTLSLSKPVLMKKPKIKVTKEE
jgi:hypothetical protein